MYRHEAMDDPVCVTSITGYVIVVANCPIMWQFKLQSETALPPMEADPVALAHRCCKLLPILNGVSIIGKAIVLPAINTTMQVSIHNDHAGALVPAKTLLSQFTCQSRHYHIKTISFQEEIMKHGIKFLRFWPLSNLGI